MPRARFMWTAAFLLGTQALAQPGSVQKGADDDAGYRAATGLLHRNMPEQAAAEYRAFLRDHPRHAQVPNAKYGLAVCLSQLTQWREAADELDGLADLKDFEFAPDALLLRAQCAAALQDQGGPIEPLVRLLDQFPKFERADAAAALLGESLYRTDKFDDAAEVLERFAKEWPRSGTRPRAEFILALVETSKGRHLEAANRLESLRTGWSSSELVPQATLTEAQCRHRLALADPSKPDREQIDVALRLYSLAAKSGQDQLVPEALLGAAQLTRASGKPADAGRTLDDLLKRFASKPIADAARLERGRAYLDENKPDRALTALESVSDKSPLAPDRAYWAAKCEVRLERFDAAAERLELALQSFPKGTLVPDMLYDRAWALGRGGHTPEARAAFAQFCERFPAHSLVPEALAAQASLALTAGDGESATDLARRFLAKYAAHPRAASVQSLLADAELSAGHTEQAAREYEAFLSAHPNDAQARNAALRGGLALAKLGKIDEATAALTKAMAAKGEAEPSLLQSASLLLADAAIAKGDWAAAEQRLRAITESPEGRTSDALLKLGICIERAGRHDEALAIFDPLARDARAGAAGTQAAFERGQILAAQGKLDEARTAFEQVVAREAKAKDPRFTVHSLRHLASIASQQGHSEQAAELLSKVAQAPDAGSGAADALCDQAAALLSAGKYSQAELVLARFLSAAPDHPRGADARAQQAIAASRQGHYEQALDLIRTAESDAGAITPVLRAAVRYERAWALNELHRADEAKQAYATLLEDRIPPALEAHAALDLAQLTIAVDDYAGAVALLARAETAAGSAGGEDGAGISERALYLRGLCQLKTDHAAEAAETLDEFLKAHPKSDLAIAAGLLAGQAHLRAHHPELAAERLSRVVDASPAPESLGPALLCLGEALAASQRWAQSQAAFERYQREFTESDLGFQAQFGIGWALENQGHHAEAISAYREVVNRHKGPTAARAQFQIGECLFAQKSHEEAVRELLKVDILYAYPEWSAAALYEAGRCLVQLNKTAEARRQFQQVTDRFKDTEWATLAARQLKDTAAEPLPGSAAPGTR